MSLWSQVCKATWCVCEGEVRCEGNKELTFFLRGGTRYGEWRWWLMCTCKAHKGRCNGVAGVPQKSDMTVMG